MNNVGQRENERGHRLCTFGILISFPALKQMERNLEKNLKSANNVFSSGLEFAKI